nr:hypothetical protein GCM10020092_106150 [Actinoplanes digitatis]
MSVEAGHASSALVRRVRLPNDRRTPAAARALVRTVLEEAGLDALVNEALLLTTELSTNAVVHAGTELDIEVEADTGGLTVTVTDFAPGPVEQLAVGPRNDKTEIGEVAERGRGLLLVDHFASRWGTVHEGSGKGVWFRLVRKGPPGTELATDGGEVTPTVGELTTLLQIGPERQTEEGLAEFAAELLARLARLTGATGGVVRLDHGDGGGRAAAGPARPRTPRRRRDDPGAADRPAAVLGRARAGRLPAGYAQPLAIIVAERLSLHLENDRLRRADLRRQTWLTFLAEASELLAQSLDVNLTMALIPRLVVPRLGQWCAVHTTDAWGRLQLAAATHADEEAVPQLHAALAETGPDSILARLEEASRLGQQAMFGTPSEGFAVPLVARGQPLGTLAVGRHLRHRQDGDEVAVLEDVARRAALAIDNARIHDERRKVARTLQASLLPPALPHVPGIGFAAEYVPTGAEVGGDFYDVVSAGDDSWIVVVGDVSGKGVQAATVTGLVRDVIRILVDDGKPMTEILCRVNRTLVQRGGGRYCTLAMASVVQAGQNLEVCLHLAEPRPGRPGTRGRQDVLRRRGRDGARPARDDHLTGRAGNAVPGRLADLLHRRRHRATPRPRAVRHRPPARRGEAARGLSGGRDGGPAALDHDQLLGRGAPRRHRHPGAPQRRLILSYRSGKVVSVAKTQFYTATTIDGFIADENNSLDWLFEADSDPGSNPFTAFFAEVGAFAMGATTYEWVMEHDRLDQEPIKWSDYYGDVPAWVFTHRTLPPVPGADLTFVQGDVRPVHEAMVSAARRQEHLAGRRGGELAGAFADAGLLDEIILGVAPVALGAGAPLLPRRIESSRLTLTGVEQRGQFAYLTYAVGAPA